MANVVTYFGDVTTVGNTVVSQNLTSQGNYSIFSGNVNPAVNLGSNLGSASATFGQVFLTASNVSTMNATTIPGTVGVNVVTDLATGLLISGNAYVSNSISTQNVYAPTSANVVTLNTGSIFGLGFQVGIGTSGSSASLNVAGNVSASNAVTAPNVIAATVNSAFINTTAIFAPTGFLGINVAGSGYALTVAGNVWASNAIGSQNVFASSFANVPNINTTTIVSTTGFVGINTPGGSANLNVAGNVTVSNALAAPLVLATTSINVNSLNTAAIFSPTTFLGINAPGVGAALSVGNVNTSNALTGNVWSSNALSAPRVLATTSANVASLNTSYIFTSTGFVGVNTTGGSATLNVFGNIYVSNGLGATNVFPTMNANIVSMNVTSMNLISYGVGINTPAQAGTVTSQTAPTGAVSTGTLVGTATVVGNAPTSNVALSVPNSTSWLALGTSSPVNVNISTLDMFVEAWVYLPAGFTGTAQIAAVGSVVSTGWRLVISTGTMFFDNNRQSRTINITISTGAWHHIAAASSQNSRQITQYLDGANRNVTTWGASGPSYSATDAAYIGAFNGTGGGDGYYIRDVRVSYGTLAGSGVSFTPESAPFGSTVPSYAITSGGTAAYRLYQTYNFFLEPLVKVAGNVWCSNAFQTPSALVTNVLTTTTNFDSAATKQIFSPAAGGIIGVAQVPAASSATLQVTGNVFASNALQSSNINVSTSANTTSSNVLTITNATLKVGVNKGTPAASLDVLGNVFVSNALQSSTFSPASANSILSNVTSNLFTNSNQLLGINKASPTSTLDVSGNVSIPSTVFVTGIDQQLPVAPFDGAGVAGAYTNVTNGVTFTVGATAETSGHEAWRAVSVPTTIANSVTIPPVGKFQLYEGESMVTNNQLWSPNGRWYLYLQGDFNWVLYDSAGILGGWSFLTIGFAYGAAAVTRITLTTDGFMLGYNSAGVLKFTSPNTATGYGPYRFAVENAGYFAIYDRYNTIIWQSNTPSAGWQTSGTYGGDTVTSAGGYRIHTFTTVSAQRFVIPNYISSLSVDYLIVAGGGGGGFDGAGGGGAGGIIAGTTTLSNGVYTVTIGGGGAGATGYAANGSQGGNSSLVNTIGGSAISQTAIGGGGGYDGHAQVTAITTGGSGGGGGFSTAANEAIASGPGLGTAGQGNNGGAGYNNGAGTANAGGGGGAYSAVGGAAANSVGGTGAAGYTTSISGASTTYAGGGGGGTWTGSGNAAGGAGGGGAGGATNGFVTAGSAATFYGGGGGGGGYGTGGGGNGFQGIVIIRYLISSVAVSNAWGFSTVPQTLTFRMPTYYVPSSLLIQGIDYNNSTNSANAFTFSGSTDGTNYKTLVASSTYLANTDYGYNIYSITTNTAWNYFQLRVTGADAVPGYVNQMILNGQISWSPTANAVTTNVTAANVLTIAGQVGVNTSTGIGATLQVLGNVYASNALFGTIRSPLANTTTLNTSSLYGTSGPVGFNVIPVAGGPTLQFGTGNVYVSNAFTSPNVTASARLTYSEDLTRRSPHLTPSGANSAAIVTWMKASCNATQKVGWSVSSAPTFSTATVGVTGSALYSSSLLAPDGRVYFTPCNATNIGVFNPKTNEFSTIVPLGGTSLTGTYKYSAAVLVPNGNILFIANTSATNLVFNPVSKTASDSTSIGASTMKGGVLGPDGLVYIGTS